MDLTPIFEKVKGKHLIFTQNGKIIKDGILTSFNVKSFNLRFDLQNTKTNSIKAFELPYPFNIIKQDKSLVFDYRLSNLKSLIDKAELIDFIKENNKQPSHLLDSTINISVIK